MNLEVHKTMIQNLKKMKCDTALSGAIALNLIKERLTKVLMNQANMYKFMFTLREYGKDNSFFRYLAISD